jgi:3-keto-disaccharide hydrolase
MNESANRGMVSRARVPTIVAALASLVSSIAIAADGDPDREEWISLFNGRDLNGWTAKITKHELGDNYADTFRVEDGLIKVRYDRYESFDQQYGLLFYDTPYSYYRLVVEYRFVGEQAKGGPGAWALRNSGVMLHSQTPRTMTRDQTFPISIEAQFLGGLSDGKPRPTLNMCSPGTEVVYQGTIYPQHCLSSTSRTYDGDQWVRAEIIVLGAGQITHRLEGSTVLEYALPQYGGGDVRSHDPAAKPDGQLIEGGYLALQSESHPIDFRRVDVLNLVGCMDRKALNYKRYYVKSDPAACKYPPSASAP